ncbi:MAG: cell division protein FtsL [Burkholderiaceae bacterium]
MNKLSVVLLAALVACALGLVTSQNRARQAFAELERAQAAGRQAALVYSQLEVEQSALSKNSLIDGKARRSLAMQAVTNERTLHLNMTASRPTVSARAPAVNPLR